MVTGADSSKQALDPNREAGSQRGYTKLRGEVAMTLEQEGAVRALIEGLAFHDSFSPRSDDAQIYVSETGDHLYEFASLHSNECLRLGHLRAIASIFTQES